MSNVTLTLDGRQITVPAGTTLLAAAQIAGLDVPTLCYHPTLTPPAICRLCTVEVAGQRVLQPACVVPAADKMEVQTNSPRVQRSRRLILELLASTVDLSAAPEIQAMMQTYAGDATRFAGGLTRQAPLYDDNPFYIRDYNKCIMCWRCIQVCAEDVQYTYALTWGKRGLESHVATFFEHGMSDTSCVFCGNCVGVCPTGALQGKVEWALNR